ncbi:MAG: hypothetical protein JW789_04985 [Candidatus Aenigmarchaeota archaeon]|nr:hypothetical protein [Candidatus Aenigmarchaeota archaeon]
MKMNYTDNPAKRAARNVGLTAAGAGLCLLPYASEAQDVGYIPKEPLRYESPVFLEGAVKPDSRFLIEGSGTMDMQRGTYDLFRPGVDVNTSYYSRIIPLYMKFVMSATEDNEEENDCMFPIWETGISKSFGEDVHFEGGVIGKEFEAIGGKAMLTLLIGDGGVDLFINGDKYNGVGGGFNAYTHLLGDIILGAGYRYNDGLFDGGSITLQGNNTDNTSRYNDGRVAFNLGLDRSIRPWATATFRTSIDRKWNNGRPNSYRNRNGTRGR